MYSWSKVFRRTALCGLTICLFLIIVYGGARLMFPRMTSGYRLHSWDVWRLVPKAEMGDIDAISRLRFHYESLGDRDRRLYWLRKGSAYGDPESQLVIFDTLKRRTEPSLQKEAKDNLQRAVDQDYVWAQLQLAEEYLEGGRYPRNNQEAEKWFRKAAYNGQEDAMRRLSILLTETHTDRRSMTEAYMWTLIALSRIDSRLAYADYFKQQQQAILLKGSQAGIEARSIEHAATEAAEKTARTVRTEEKHTIPFGSPK